MSRSLYVDTCSLIAIAYSGMAPMVFRSLNIHISHGVIRELENISGFNDQDAKMADLILNCMGLLILEETCHMDDAEDELIDLCSRNHGIIVTDDLKAIKRLEDEIITLNSVHLIYILFKKNLICRNDAIKAFEKMRRMRDWKNNMIVTIAKTLLVDE